MSKLSDRDLLLGFETATLPAEDFDHTAHVRVAWLYLKAHPFFEAASRVRSGLIALSRAHGAPERFHETITLAFLALLHERLSNASPAGFAQFAEENSDLLSTSVLKKFYSSGRLEQPAARTGFLLPDRQLTTR
jgi:hypothetical protein